MSAKNTVRLHRVLATKPEKVYRAFLDPDALARWLPPNGFTGHVHHSDAKVGGAFKMSFTNFSTGSVSSFGGEYLELVPNERLRYTDRFDDQNLPGEMQTTVTLKKVASSTELDIVQEGIQMRSRSMPATSAGKNRYATWLDWWSRISLTERCIRL
jgi:uncharacterized protein YndB with AHSA1/START domain